MNQEQKVTPTLVNNLLTSQLKSWPLLRDNYQAFEKIQIKKFQVERVEIIVQFNPSRIVSSEAKTDPQSIRERKCFLCINNLPPEQEYVSFGDDYLILCNPYPIFPQHFTVPTRDHVEQSIMNRLSDMMELSRQLETCTVFYNGPRSGASAPDHMHFQIVTRYYMPIDKIEISQTKLIYRGNNSELYLLTDYLRNGFIIQSENKTEAQSLFMNLCRGLELPVGETEPMMNIFCNYQAGKWIIKVIPRRKHRPSQYFAEGEKRIITAPGAADIGGVFICSREEDFTKINPELLKDIYEQICFSNKEIELFANQIVKQRIK